MIEALCKKNNLKITKQRKIVIDIISSLGDNATLKNILSKTSESIDNSTVYRIIDLFVSKNIIEKQINYNEEIFYSIREEHGHYINCVRCHKKEKINDCPIESIEKDLEVKGYEILNHTIQIDGICKDCQIKK